MSLVNADERFHLPWPPLGLVPPQHWWPPCPPAGPHTVCRHRARPPPARVAAPGGLQSPPADTVLPPRPTERGEPPGAAAISGARGVTHGDPRPGEGGHKGEGGPRSSASPMRRRRGEGMGRNILDRGRGGRRRGMNNLNKSATEPRRGGGRRRVM